MQISEFLSTLVSLVHVALICLSCVCVRIEVVVEIEDHKKRVQGPRSQGFQEIRVRGFQGSRGLAKT